MGNHLNHQTQVQVIGSLVEGASIRSIERITGTHRDTVMRLGVRVGMACHGLLDRTMTGLRCQRLQVDEIWGFIGKKQRAVRDTDDRAEVGDVWTYVAIDPQTKLVPAFLVGKRDPEHTNRFVAIVADRVTGHIQFSTDGLNQYPAAVQAAWGVNRVDYGQAVKVFGQTGEGRYSPGEVLSVTRNRVYGDPEPSAISTSIVERQNLTMRMHCRRLTRLTNAFSKKLENFRAAVALHFAYYNFVKIHGSLRVTPAMEAGLTDRVWAVADLVNL